MGAVGNYSNSSDPAARGRLATAAITCMAKENPWYLTVIGGAFLAVTGGEAFYADNRPGTYFRIPSAQIMEIGIEFEI